MQIIVIQACNKKVWYLSPDIAEQQIGIYSASYKIAILMSLLIQALPDILIRHFRDRLIQGNSMSTLNAVWYTAFLSSCPVQPGRIWGSSIWS